MKKALIVWGGWDGHQPQEVAGLCARLLAAQHFETLVSDSLDSFLDPSLLAAMDLIVPVWTMGQISPEQCRNVTEAVAAGTGIAGCHGGMCDAFRENVDWQFMTGGQWVAHPGNDGVEYVVRNRASSHPIMDGIPDFTIRSEQYYLQVDPANQVLASTEFPVADGPHAPNGPVTMPVAWTKRWGKGRVFYTSLGHQVNIVEAEPVRTMLERGLLWASR